MLTQRLIFNKLVNVEVAMKGGNTFTTSKCLMHAQNALKK